MVRLPAFLPAHFYAIFLHLLGLEGENFAGSGFACYTETACSI